MIHDLSFNNLHSLKWSSNGISASPNTSYWQHIRALECWAKSVSAETIWVTHKVAALGSKMHIGMPILWCPQPRGKLLTSLLRQAFKCNGLVDMKNCQVVSAQGWGPGFSGAYCTLRISRRAEFLGSSRGRHGGTSCLAEAGVLHSRVLTPKKPNDKWSKSEPSTKVHYWTTHRL